MSGYQEPRRLGIGPYWARYAASFAGSIVSMIVAAFSFFSGSYAMLFLASLAMIGSGIYLRVIEVRRCRDIGWDPMLPWYFLGGSFVLAFLMIISGPLAVLFSLMAMVVGMVDFIGSIVIGCLPSVYDSPSSAPRPAAYASYGAPSDYHERPEDDRDSDARYEEAIARALADQRKAPAARAEPAPPGPPPRVAGFGRKGLGNQTA